MADYRDYVIKDGRFIGAFEEMYRNCEDPWHQDAIRDQLAEDVALSMLSRYRYQRALDIGCGKGRFTARLKAALGAHMTGIDISPSAIQAAQSRFSEIEFISGQCPPLHFPDRCFDLVASAELLWYVLPEISHLFSEIRRVLKPGGHYLITQHFYQAGQQSYGTEVMQIPQDLIRMLPFRILHHVEVEPLSNHKFVALLENVP
jgi:ubiquinone/menaquinone biosynthesis C-methylase UbiE